ncbi:MAG: EamA family transporter [Bacteroidetes bacterium]|nr:MAG: EamA family transporter [Bacteroidota bacterium]
MYWEKPWFQFAILILLAFTWGSSFILMKIGLKSFSNEQAAALRIIFASLVLLPYSIKNLKYLKLKDLKSILMVGFIGSFITAFLFMKAQTRIDSAMAGMLNSLTPVFTLLVGMLFYRMLFAWKQIVGLSLGLIGALGLITFGEDVSIGNINSYAFLIVLASVFYAVSVNEVKARLTHLTGMQITALTFFFIGPVALVYLFATDLDPIFQQPDWQIHFAALALLGIVGTAFALVMMNSLIRRVSPIYAASVTYIIPVFAIFWGVMDGEQISFFHLLFMTVIMAGVYIINRKK